MKMRQLSIPPVDRAKRTRLIPMNPVDYGLRFSKVIGPTLRRVGDRHDVLILQWPEAFTQSA